MVRESPAAPHPHPLPTEGEGRCLGATLRRGGAFGGLSRSRGPGGSDPGAPPEDGCRGGVGAVGCVLVRTLRLSDALEKYCPGCLVSQQEEFDESRQIQHHPKWRLKVLVMRRRTFLTCLLLPAFAAPAFGGGHNPMCNFRGGYGGAYLGEQGVVVYGSRSKELMAEARADGRPVSVLVETMEEYSQAYRALRSEQLPKGSLLFFDSSNNPGPIVEKVDSPIGRVVILYNIPRSVEEVIRIHGSGISPSRASANIPALRSIASRMAKVGGIDVNSLKTGTIAQGVSNYVNSLPGDNLILFLSHVIKLDAERSYKLPLLPFEDGSRYSPVMRTPALNHFGSPVPNIWDGKEDTLWDMSKLGPTVWTIGCSTWDTIINDVRPQVELLTSRSLTYEHGAAAILAMRAARSIRDAASSILTKQPLETELLRNLLPSLQQQHAPLERPPETYFLKAEIIPGNNLYTETAIV